MRLFLGSSAVVTVLMGFASLLGLTVEGIYRDNALVKASWMGNDLVTLVVAVPLLVGAMLRARRASGTAMLICLGMLAYAAYNYAFYLFGAAFNSLFLVYVGAVTFATLGLIGGLTSTQLLHLVEQTEVRRRDRIVGRLIVAIALLLGVFWVTTSVDFLVTGELPAMVTATEHPTNVTAALDLWLVVTFGLLGGLWLISGRPWGFVISVIWAIKGAVYMMALSAASLSAFLRGATGSLAQVGLWMPIGVACFAGAVLLLSGRTATLTLAPGAETRRAG